MHNAHFFILSLMCFNDEDCVMFDNIIISVFTYVYLKYTCSSSTLAQLNIRQYIISLIQHN